MKLVASIVALSRGQYLIARRNSGRSYVSVPAPAGLSKGWYREGRASIVIGSTSEPVDAEVSGRLVLHIDEGLYPALIRARGYQWRVSGPQGIVTGSVSFSGDVAKAIGELRACVKANTAATPAARTSGNLKWSGDWVWIRPMVIFGKPVDTRGQQLSIELLPNNRVNICVDLRRSDTCKNAPFTEKTGSIRCPRSGRSFTKFRSLKTASAGNFGDERKIEPRLAPMAHST
ncbi:MAG: hypothetical protein WAP03_15485 [Methylorubrum rhodinum]|uniref:hypothetical protein n=1 Tax=Methylorubrum rhodinum TaxID=29428 RepID=UPI003BB059D0